MKNQIKDILTFLMLNPKELLLNIGVQSMYLIFLTAFIITTFWIYSRHLHTPFIFIAACFILLVIHVRVQTFSLSRTQFPLNVRYHRFIKDLSAVDSSILKTDPKPLRTKIKSVKKALRKQGFKIFGKKIIWSLSVLNGEKIEPLDQQKSLAKLIKAERLLNIIATGLFFLILIPFFIIALVFTLNRPFILKSLIFTLGIAFAIFVKSITFRPILFLLMQKKASESWIKESE